MMDRGTVRNIEFYSKNKNEKLVHLVVFIIRIYNDARSPERQIWNSKFVTKVVGNSILLSYDVLYVGV